MFDAPCLAHRRQAMLPVFVHFCQMGGSRASRSARRAARDCKVGFDGCERGRVGLLRFHGLSCSRFSRKMLGSRGVTEISPARDFVFSSALPLGVALSWLRSATCGSLISGSILGLYPILRWTHDSDPAIGSRWYGPQMERKQSERK